VGSQRVDIHCAERRSGALPALLSLALVPLVAALLLLLGAPSDAAAAGGVHELDRGGVRSYWTPERMRAAEPVPAPRPGSAALATSPQTQDAPVDRDQIANPSAEPFRAHGRVFFTIAGGSFPGDFVCSGTAINSLNRSTVWTAGHCVYDHEDRGGYATNWVFVPAYEDGDAPFGEWPAKTLAATKQWRRQGALSYDLGAAEVATNPQGQTLNDVVGGRGIGFNRARQQTYQAFGYPAQPPFSGEREYRCSAGGVGADNPPGPGPNTSWIPCDMTGGSSGGGWVAKGRVLSVISYSYCIDSLSVQCENRLYGPYQEHVAESLYRSVAGEAVFCAGREVTHLGTPGPDRLVGTSGPDVFKALGGNDEVIGKRGRDRVCAGGGKDLVKGNAGKDKLKGKRGRDTLRGGRGRDKLRGGPGRDKLRGGRGRDVCNGGPGRDKAAGCERTRRVP